ncbi:MAG: ABC-type sugar transport system permease subunit [Candidatus Omnitrophota bacterium]|jgi:ABC-type sugar transport system permease subunit/ABC-type glycerol-3-phosphate transport system substrate-binding protein
MLPWRNILLMLTTLVFSARAGFIEHVGDRTIIHVTVHDWLWEELDPIRTETGTRANAAAVKAFREQFPDIFAAKYQEKYGWNKVDVRIEKFSGIKIEGIESDLLAIAGKMAPDIIYLNFRKSDTYIQQGFLYPMDRPEDGYFSEMSEAAIAFRINPKIRPVIDRKGPGGKHVWALPHGGAIGKVLIYRKDLFDEANIPYPDKTWTWDDLYAACQKLANPATGQYAIALRNVKDESWRWIDFLFASGSRIMEYDEPTDRWEIAFDNPNTVAALDYYVKLCTEPWKDAEGRQRRGYAYRDPSYTAANQAWKNGSIAMMLGTIQEDVFARTFDPTVVGLAPMPMGPGGQRTAALNSKMLGLFAEIEHEAIRDAAWEFIRYYGSEAATEIKTRILVEGGLGRFVNPTYLKQFGYDELIRFAPPGWQETFEIAIRDSEPEPYGRFANPVYNILDRPIKEANSLALEEKLPTETNARNAVLASLIKEAAGVARREILAELPPQEMKKRRTGAGMFILALLALFAIVFRIIVKSFTPPGDIGKHGGWQFRKYGQAYLLLLPAILTILVWQYVPLLQGSIMAFQDYKVMGGSDFVGLDNFGNVLWNPEWWASVWNAIRYSFLIVVLTFIPPVILAILLQEIPYAKVFFRTIYYLPAVITSLVVILLWHSFYAPTELGALNRLIMQVPAWAFLVCGAGLFWICVMFSRRLKRLDSALASWLFIGGGALLFAACYGLATPALNKSGVAFPASLLATAPEPYHWLESHATAMIACVIPLFWASIGPGCLIYLAALKGIAEELYEAADMDGATFIDKILFIVFPIFKPLLIINFVGIFIGSWFYAGANILAMTQGQAGTEVAGLHIFYQAFMFLKFGPATAMAWILGFMLIVFTMYQLRILSRLEFKTTGEK